MNTDHIEAEVQAEVKRIEAWNYSDEARRTLGHTPLSVNQVASVARYVRNRLMVQDAQIKALREALIAIKRMPCISMLLGELPEDNGGCGCASCTATAALAAKYVTP